MAKQERLFSALPERSGLYDPSFEHDACGVAMVATLNKKASHEIVQQGLQALRNLNHRGASGAEPNSELVVTQPASPLYPRILVTYLALKELQQKKV